MCEKFLKWCRKNKIDLGGISILIIVFLFTEVFLFFETNSDLKLLSGEPLVAEGNITNVYRWIRRSDKFIICLGEPEFELYEDPSGRRTYGIRDDISLESYENILKGKRGYPARIEYYQVAPNTRWITRLTIMSEEYLDSETALKDHQEAHKETLCWIGASFIITLIALVFVRKCRSLQKTNYLSDSP